jgi:hypothetical protein
MRGLVSHNAKPRATMPPSGSVIGVKRGSTPQIRRAAKLARLFTQLPRSKAGAPWTTTKKKSMIFGQTAVIKSAHDFAISESCFMDVMIFLKLAPVEVGASGDRHRGFAHILYDARTRARP